MAKLGSSGFQRFVEKVQEIFVTRNEYSAAEDSPKFMVRGGAFTTTMESMANKVYCKIPNKKYIVVFDEDGTLVSSASIDFTNPVFTKQIDQHCSIKGYITGADSDSFTVTIGNSLWLDNKKYYWIAYGEDKPL